MIEYPLKVLRDVNATLNTVPTESMTKRHIYTTATVSEVQKGVSEEIQ